MWGFDAVGEWGFSCGIRYIDPRNIVALLRHQRVLSTSPPRKKCAMSGVVRGAWDWKYRFLMMGKLEERIADIKVLILEETGGG